MEKFVKINRYGQLYIDKVIFESTFPIVFSCLNDNKDVFIVVCCKRNKDEIKWLAGKTDGHSICRMLKDEITVRQLLVNESEGRITINYSNDCYSCEFDNEDWKENSIFLPKEDSYMYADEGEFDEEIRYFSSLEVFDYDSNKYQNITKISDGLKLYSESIELVLKSFLSDLGEISVDSKIVKTLDLCKKLVSNVAFDHAYEISTDEFTILNQETTHNLTPEDVSMEYDRNKDEHVTDAA